MDFAVSHKTRIIIRVQAVLYILFIIAGISGSSISLIRHWAPGLVSMDERILAGHPKGIRSDEWAVNTLMAIGQYQNKDSRNPRINSSVGPTPRDMSVIHDTGVPTSELAAVSKVNLWGFFMFDLRRALAWDWWIPVFIGLNGVWLLLNLLCPGQTVFNFTLALVFALAPECVMWSNWPLMHVGTASLAVSLAILALRNGNPRISLALALCTGLLVSWFALQLYLPRLIPVALVSVAVYAGYCINSHARFLSKANCLFIIYTALITSFFLFDWFYHNYDAISRMLHSSYPGQRRIYGGTSMSGWDFNYVRGWLFPVTGKESFFSDYKKMPGDPSSSMSYISLILPIIGAAVYYFFRNFRKVNYILLFNFTVFLLFLAYEYTGLPEIIGKLTFLNRSMPARSIIGVGLSSVIMLAFLYKYRVTIRSRYRIILLCIYLLPFFIYFYRNPELVNYLKENYLSRLLYIVFFATAIHFIFLYRIRYIALALLLFVAPVTLLWNPLVVAPSYLRINLPAQLPENGADLKYGGRFMVIDWFVSTNVMLAGGESVMNATSHYVDPYMFEHFYSKLDNPEQYNRFNHLMIFADDQKPDIGISLGGNDWIKMRLNARDFDFSTMPADYVLARNSPHINDMNANSRLDFVGRTGDFYLYRIKNLQP